MPTTIRRARLLVLAALAAAALTGACDVATLITGTAPTCDLVPFDTAYAVDAVGDSVQAVAYWKDCGGAQ